MLKQKLKRNIPTLIYLVTLYVAYQILTTIITVFTDQTILKMAKESPSGFIVLFGGFYFLYIILAVGVLYSGHILSKQDGHYELSLLILNILSTFTTLTTIILKFSGAQMPAPLLPMTFFIILTTISLATTSKLLQMRANRLAKAN
ncbi:hypothetical protein ACPBEH_04185 [Latilactobacillus sp. 5-91]|uniref:hypothetical protein n=1 Tax=Latilactobacillus TaxID=2767885 RepID=UPI002072F042|nr:hypothetical protein [Latilactobacillus sakei]USG02071.1 hypothetical protein A4W86_03220 [Latilactobacillus sakei]